MTAIIYRCIRHSQIKEFIYESEQAREDHIVFMKGQGWTPSEAKKLLKPGVNVATATEQDCDWYAQFSKDQDYSVTYL